MVDWFVSFLLSSVPIMKSEYPPDNPEFLKPIKSEPHPEHAQDSHSQEITSPNITVPPSYEWVLSPQTHICSICCITIYFILYDHS